MGNNTAVRTHAHTYIPAAVTLTVSTNLNIFFQYRLRQNIAKYRSIRTYQIRMIRFTSSDRNRGGTENITRYE